MKPRILYKSNKSIEPKACDSSAAGERLSDGWTNPTLGVAQRWERWHIISSQKK